MKREPKKLVDGGCTNEQRRYIMQHLSSLRPPRYGYTEGAPKIPKPTRVAIAEEQINRMRKIVREYETRAEKVRRRWAAQQNARIDAVERLALFGRADIALTALEKLEAERRAK